MYMSHTCTCMSYSCRTVLPPQLLCVEGAGVHGVEGHLAGGREDGSRLGEEVIVARLSLDGRDQHRVAGILVRLQHCEGVRV